MATQLLDFERDISRAFRGIAPPSLKQSLNAEQFLQVLKDLSTFAVGLWPSEQHRHESCLDQQAAMLWEHCPTLFDHRRTRRATHLRLDGHAAIARIADPATRRAALWLVMEVIRLPPSPRPKHLLRLGQTAQDAFFGSVDHDGRAWLTQRAQSWPEAYRSYYWAGFSPAEGGVDFPAAMPSNQFDPKVPATPDRYPETR